MKNPFWLQCFLFVGFMLAGDSGARADSVSAAEKEAEEYMQTWEDRGREACKDNERGCAAAGHALDRAADAYERAGNLDKAITIRKMILEPQWHLDYTDYGRIAAFTLARNYQSIAEYAEAAQLIETATKRFAKSDEAPDALLEATNLRLSLGEVDKAIDDMQLFSKNYGGKRATEIPPLVTAIASWYWGHGQPKESLAFVEKYLTFVDKHGNPTDRALAHVLAARIHAHDGAQSKALVEYEIVRGVWAQPYEAVKAINSAGGTENEQMRRLGQALTAVGEALFFFAEQKRAEAEAIRFPEYVGPGNKDSVIQFISTKAAPWMQKKRTAIEDADHEYQKILQLQPAPPPRWVIAAAGRVGFLWANFVSDFKRAPTPKEWNSKNPLPGTSMPGTEIKKIYLESLSSLSEPLTLRSKHAFRVCVDDSMKFQWADEHSEACAAWLEKNYPKEWIAVEEFRPGPRYSAMPMTTMPIAPVNH